MRYSIFFGTILMLITAYSAVVIASDYARESRRAQKMLSEGEYTRAFQMYSALATEKNNPLAQFTLALFYEYGWGRKPDRLEACKWYANAAKGDIPAAAHYYAACLEKGVAFGQSLPDAISWYEQAVVLGHGGSHFPAARLLLAAENDADKARGLKHLLQAASIGNQQAQLQLGAMYMQGQQVKKKNLSSLPLVPSGSSTGKPSGPVFVRDAPSR